MHDMAPEVEAGLQGEFGVEEVGVEGPEVEEEGEEEGRGDVSEERREVEREWRVEGERQSEQSTHVEHIQPPALSFTTRVSQKKEEA